MKPASGPVLAIGFRRSGRTLDWTGQDATLLDFAERHSVMIESGCRTGSDAAQRSRDPNDRLRRYKAIARTIDVPWGEKDGRR